MPAKAGIQSVQVFPVLLHGKKVVYSKIKKNYLLDSGVRRNDGGTYSSLVQLNSIRRNNEGIFLVACSL